MGDVAYFAVMSRLGSMRLLLALTVMTKPTPTASQEPIAAPEYIKLQLPVVVNSVPLLLQATLPDLKLYTKISYSNRIEAPLKRPSA
mgnify:CR=1 FL=1